MTVYLAGRGDGEPALPCFWKNTEQTNLTAAYGGDAYSIDISGSSIYVGGRVYTNNGQTHFIPCFWKNGSIEELPLPYLKSVGIVKSIEVSNGIAYCAGFYSDSLPSPVNNWFYQPCLWKSNEDELIPLEVLDKNPISGEGWYGMAESVATVSNSNATGYCVVGSSQDEEGWSSPCYWTVGLAAAQVPQDEIKAHALPHMGYGGSALAVSATLDPKFGGDLSQSALYMAGYVYDEDELNVPCYWYQGQRTNLSKLSNNDHGAATAIFSNGTELYIAGYSFSQSQEQIPCVWKGSARTDLPLPANAYGGRATSVIKYKDDVYVGGTINANGTEYPCYWKNGEIVQLNKPGIANAMTLDLD